MKFIATFLLWSCLLGAAGAEPPRKCVVCGDTITGKFFWIESPSLAERQAVCLACQDLPARCAVCRLPVRANVRKLDDGRLLCERDGPVGIFQPAEAQGVFLETKRELMAMLAGVGVLPDKNITVSLVNATELTRLHKGKSADPKEFGLQGLTHTTIRDKTQFQHHIYLLNGLPRARLAAVCAHEYGHTWINENVATRRRLEGDTIEGFCELVAYKLMAQRREEVEMKLILANTYTHGQIHALVQAEKHHQFARVIDWMKNGVDDSIFKTNTTRLLALNQNDPPELNWHQAPPTPVPDRLMLKGISGPISRRLALINDRTLAKNEQGRVRVGQTHLIVRCLDITDCSVVILVQGAVKKTELFLREN